ncbi:M23 family metallopeptidase [Nocardioides rotundus]|uniref:M23 family metallopeptidase n=1 Tax=Nocardioides rotundus TaxID=1774216 RepID=UPI001CBD61E7|nr:M23 family metallopeptidase [Nocardioides rotundus]UAL29799.1 M23 family metallopeptidase [Nocardioides rotundus]
MKKAVLVLVALMLLGPMLGLLGIGVLMNPAANAACTINGGGISVGNVPDELTVTTQDGTTFTLNRQQLTHAATIIEVGSGIEGVGRDGIQIALMAALTESTLRMLANTGAYPESGTYPNDGNGSDHDSLGLFQMRPATGWGTVAELMDSTYQARAFFGGPTGPNHPSPRGLLDIPGWQEMDKGSAAQAVEVSAYPDRYRNYEPVAETILDTLTSGAGLGSGGPVSGSSQVVFPLPEGSWVLTDEFGPRIHPITGEQSFHTGTDFAAPDGTPILAAAGGVVTVAEFTGGYGGLIVVEHDLGGESVATAYAHSWQDGIHVAPGDTVTAGQHIGDVGSSGMSTGPHLHFEVRLGGTGGEHTDPAVWLNDHNAADLPEATGGGPTEGCQGGNAAFDPETGIAPPVRNPDGSWPAESCSLPDPTQPGRQGACVTPRTATIAAQIEAMQVGDNGITCWDPHAWNPTSDHPKGKACDIVFGTIGQFPAGADKDNGDQLADWLVANAETWAVSYVIWQGRIWTAARADDGWRPYTGGGIYDPSDPTGGHFDHIHLSVE